MSNKKPLYFDCLAGSEIRDTQGELLSVEGADISHLENGLGLWNDNHGAGIYNTLGRITEAKKILKEEDCENERHRYYWNKVKAPYIYASGYLFDDEDHPNARAAAAILRNIHKEDCPLKMKASVEGGVIMRGVTDPRLLARTKITKVALTFTPANQNTLVEPLNLDKSATNHEADMLLIKKAMHLVQTDTPSFRQITRQATAESVRQKIEQIVDLAKSQGIEVDADLDVNKLVQSVLKDRIVDKINQIDELTKALVAGYGGASAPTDRTGGSVIQTESLPLGRGFKYITCYSCGDEQVHGKNQTKCRRCGKSFGFDQLAKLMLKN